VIPLAVTLERECVEELLLKNVDAEACRVAASFNKAVNVRQQAGWTALSVATPKSCPLPWRYMFKEAQWMP